MCTRFFFFFNDTATTEIYTLSLHDALPISALRLTGLHSHIGSQIFDTAGFEAAAHRVVGLLGQVHQATGELLAELNLGGGFGDRKSTRLNSSHANISYAVFCLKKKNNL